MMAMTTSNSINVKARGHFGLRHKETRGQELIFIKSYGQFQRLNALPEYEGSKVTNACRTGKKGVPLAKRDVSAK
jgi:hypothetical protein